MRKKLIRFLGMMMCVSLMLCSVKINYAEEIDPRITLIYDYEKYVNEKQLEEYIDLFDSDTQEWMNQFKDDPNFFLGEKVEIKRVKLLSHDTGVKGAFIEENEFGGKEFSVYYVQAICDTSEVTSKNIKPLNGNIAYVFVFVKEDGIWKIGRVSIADINQIVAAGEGFDNKEENISLVNENIAMISTSLQEPETICIKMTKAKNLEYWDNNVYVDVPFKDYILNVVPNEFVVSHGGEYLKAGTMAVKMFGWYYTIHKKYPNSPGGCDLQDTSVDQNYLATSYEDLGRYKDKMDEAYNAIQFSALVNESGEIFCTQYNSGTTNSTTGKLGASTALSLSKSGYTYSEILQDAYNNSTNAGEETVKIETY